MHAHLVWMNKVWVGRAVCPTIPEVSFICLLIVLQLARVIGM